MRKKHESDLNRRSYIKAAGAGISLTAIAGCLGGDGGDGSDGSDGSGDGTDGDSTGDGDGMDSDPILVSSLQPLSGVFAQYGPRHSRGADYAAQQINADGGVLGREIQANHVDTASDGEEAATTFLNHIEEGAVAGIGPGSSDAAVLAGQTANDEGVPLFLHAAGGSEITAPPNDFIFRTNLAATPQSAQAQAQMIEDRGYSKGAVIYEEGLWGDEYKAGVEEYFPDGVTLQSESAPIPQQDFTPLLRNFDDDIEFFLGSGHPAGISQMYPQILDLGFETLELVTAAITPMEADWQENGESLAQKTYTSFSHVDFYSDSYAEIAQQYLDETGDIFDSAQAGGYIAIQLIAAAIEEAGEVNTDAMADALHSGSYDFGIYGFPIEYSDTGDLEGVVQIYNTWNPGESPDHWPDVGFSPEEVYRTDPMPAYDHSLEI